MYHSDLVCSCIRGVQDDYAIGMVVLQSAEILWYDMFRNTFPMRDYCIIHLSLGEQELGVRRQLWYVLFVHVVYKRMLQSAWDSMVNHMFRNTFPMYATA